MLVRVAKSFKKSTGVGEDVGHPEVFLQLLLYLREVTSTFFMKVDLTGVWPKIEGLHSVLSHSRVRKCELTNSLCKIERKSCYDTGAHFTDTGIARKGELYE